MVPSYDSFDFAARLRAIPEIDSMTKDGSQCRSQPALKFMKTSLTV